jgi:hypothetical protein
MPEVEGANSRDSENSEAGGQASGLAMPQAFQFMTEFSQNMQLFNQILLPTMNNLVATAIRHEDTVNFLNPFLNGLRRRVSALETRADRLGQSRGADNPAFQTGTRTKPTDSNPNLE